MKQAGIPPQTRRHLGDNGDELTKRAEADEADVLAVHQDPPRGGRQEPAERPHEGRLAAPTGANNRNCSSWKANHTRKAGMETVGRSGCQKNKE